MKREKSMSGAIRASMTVETALVLPVFLVLIINILSLMDLLGLYGEVELALHQTVRDIAVQSYAYQLWGNEMEDPVDKLEVLEPIWREGYARGLFLHEFTKNSDYVALLKDGMAGITFFRSDIINDEDIVDLVVTYRVQPYINIYGISPCIFMNRCRVRAWTGYDVLKNQDDGLEQWVYITENGEVYHTSPDCTHLDLSISRVLRSELANQRNENGEKYTECELCKDHGEYSLYIAREGNRYHSDRGCSGLKRTVIRVKLSEVEGRSCCERCGGTE